ncbi:MAG: hypothetical protein LUF80_04595, partial [Oscillospiraceae bacterium]|nr:hypothetical protein [Oscillospiraceae bacterium]
MEHQNPTGPGQYGSDRDTFLRVWQRVMPQQRPDCPIQPLPALPEGEGEPQPQAQGEPPEREGTVLARQPRLVQGDFPSWQDVPCLGEGAMDQAERLRQLLEGEELLWRRWKGLERRCPGVHQRALAAMGDD